MSSSVLVTGGAGFIGSSLVRELIKSSDDRIVILDKLTYAGNLDSLRNCLPDSRVSFVEGDIANKPLVAKLLREQEIQRIFNLAAESHVDRSIDGPAAFIKTNVVGTFQLLESALEYWKELFLGLVKIDCWEGALLVLEKKIGPQLLEREGYVSKESDDDTESLRSF